MQHVRDGYQKLLYSRGIMKQQPMRLPLLFSRLSYKVWSTEQDVHLGGDAVFNE
jgi:hypothetical protein